jgi:hypothetical protein
MPGGVATRPRAPGSGFPVPWVATWTSEEQSYYLGPARRGLPVIMTRGGIGQGEPVLGLMHPPRQRLAMERRICQVCRSAIPKPGWMLFLPHRGQSMPIPVHERVVVEAPLILEPWVCEPCGHYAARVCPGILSIDHRLKYTGVNVHLNGGLTFALVSEVTLVAQVVSDETMEVGDAGTSCIAYFQAAVTEFQEFPLPEFLERTEEAYSKACATVTRAADFKVPQPMVPHDKLRSPGQ